MSIQLIILKGSQDQGLNGPTAVGVHGVASRHRRRVHLSQEIPSPSGAQDPWTGALGPPVSWEYQGSAPSPGNITAFCPTSFLLIWEKFGMLGLPASLRRTGQVGLSPHILELLVSSTQLFHSPGNIPGPGQSLHLPPHLGHSQTG